MTEWEIRPFETMEEYRACVALQEETWGHGFSERVPAAILKVGRILGGVSAGAWAEDGTLAGFVFGLTGVRDGRLVHWSDMLAVRRGIRDGGLGRRLKLHQRRVLLERGIDTMYWTFDPLQSRNAHLNFTRLGILVREYRRDMYGDTDSPLHRGIGTDRFVALWEMDSERVRSRLDGVPPVPPDPERAGRALGPAGRAGAHPRPGPPDLSLDQNRILVSIPAEISRLMADDPALALAWREVTRAVFTHYLDAGWEVRELLRGDPTSDYLLER